MLLAIPKNNKIERQKIRQNQQYALALKLTNKQLLTHCSQRRIQQFSFCYNYKKKNKKYSL